MNINTIRNALGTPNPDALFDASWVKVENEAPIRDGGTCWYADRSEIAFTASRSPRYRLSTGDSSLVVSAQRLNYTGLCNTIQSAGSRRVELTISYEATVHGHRVRLVEQDRNQLSQRGPGTTLVNGIIDQEDPFFYIDGTLYQITIQGNGAQSVFSLGHPHELSQPHAPFSGLQLLRVGGALVFAGPSSRAVQGSELAQFLNEFEASYRQALSRATQHIHGRP